MLETKVKLIVHILVRFPKTRPLRENFIAKCFLEARGPLGTVVRKEYGKAQCFQKDPLLSHHHSGELELNLERRFWECCTIYAPESSYPGTQGTAAFIPQFLAVIGWGPLRWRKGWDYFLCILHLLFQFQIKPSGSEIQRFVAGSGLEHANQSGPRERVVEWQHWLQFPFVKNHDILRWIMSIIMSWYLQLRSLDLANKNTRCALDGWLS